MVQPWQTPEQVQHRRQRFHRLLDVVLLSLLQLDSRGQRDDCQEYWHQSEDRPAIRASTEHDLPVMIETLQARDNVVGGVFQKNAGIFWCFWKGGKGIRSGAGLILRWYSLSVVERPSSGASEASYLPCASMCRFRPPFRDYANTEIMHQSTP